eukprot:jgi/Bigna1/70671/fgenesh1_pg.12_\
MCVCVCVWVGSGKGYRDMGVFIVKVDGEDMKDISRHKYVGHMLPKRDREVHLEFNATDPKTTYLVIPMSFDVREDRPSFGLSIYSANPVHTRPINVDVRCVRSACLLALRTNGKPKYLQENIQMFSQNPSGCGCWYMLLNMDPRKALRFRITLKPKGLTSSRKQFDIEAIVPPLHRQILVVLTPANPG